MTITLTISTPEGIVLGADRRISFIRERRLELLDERDKIMLLENSRIGFSYWGLAGINNKTIIEHLKEVEKITKEKYDSINVNNLSAELKEYLLTLEVKIPMGIHVVGYISRKPIIRHVFHESWHRDFDFTNEFSNEEIHNPRLNSVYPHKLGFAHKDFFPLFNGDNAVVNTIINGLGFIHGCERTIDFDSLSLDKAKELAITLISFTIKMQEFLRIYDRGITCGNGIDIAIIKEESTERLETIRKFEINVSE